MKDENNHEVEIDYEALLKNALSRIEKMFAVEKEYFACLSKVNDHAEDIQIVSNHLTDMNMTDQLSILKAVIMQGELATSLREKYGFEKETI